MRALVTGGAGFIGSHLVDRLILEGHTVDVLDDLSTGTLSNLSDARSNAEGRFSFHKLDLTAPGLTDLLTRHTPDVIVHLAAKASVAASMSDPIETTTVNVEGTLNVLNAAQVAGVQRIVFASTAGIYGEVPVKQLPAKEDTPIAPTNPYAMSKVLATQWMEYYRRVHQIEFCALAFANVYGPRQTSSKESGVVSRFCSDVVAGKAPTIYGDGKQTRDFVFVDDVVDALVKATEKGGGLTLNVSTGKQTSITELADRLCVFGGGLKPTYVDARDGDVKHSALSPGRAAMILGWKPYTSLDDGLQQTFAWAHLADESS